MVVRGSPQTNAAIVTQLVIQAADVGPMSVRSTMIFIGSPRLLRIVSAPSPSALGT